MLLLCTKLNKSLPEFDVPCVNDKISGKVGDIVTIFCNINAYDDFPTGEILLSGVLF